MPAQRSTQSRAWSVTADGRVDSPPSIWQGHVLFGCRDGYVYCLRAGDGKLVWRYRVAPGHRQAVAFDQLESVWPMHGSVLVDENGRSTAYFAAGRSARLDGGIRLYALDVKSGEILYQADARVPGGQGASIIRQSVLPDILSMEHDTIWMRGLGVDKKLAPVEDMPHLFDKPDSELETKIQTSVERLQYLKRILDIADRSTRELKQTDIQVHSPG